MPKSSKKHDPKPVATGKHRMNLTRRPICEFESDSQEELNEVRQNESKHQKENDDHMENDNETDEETDISESSSIDAKENLIDDPEDDTREATPSPEARYSKKPKLPPKYKVKPDSKGSVSNITKVIWCLILIAPIVLVIACYVYYIPSDSYQQHYNFLKLELLKQHFEQQPAKSYAVVKTALKKVMEPDPKAPAIIILLHSKETKEVAYYLSCKISEVFLSVKNVTIQGAILRHTEPEVAKKQIDDAINNNLSANETGLVFVNDLDLIPAEAAIMFHSYCDHENAPFKHAVYVMTVASKKAIPHKSTPKKWDEIVDTHLKDAWNSSGYDQISSLLSRLTVSVAAVTAYTPVQTITAN